MKNEELEAMIKEASGPINFTVFLTMFGEKLKGGHPLRNQEICVFFSPDEGSASLPLFSC